MEYMTMARTKIDYDKVHFDGGPDSVKHENVFMRASKPIQDIIKAKKASATVNRVVINVGEGEAAQQYGMGILKLKNVDKSVGGVLLAEIEADGIDSVVTAYQNWLRDKTTLELETKHGDVTKQINDTVKTMVQFGGKGMTEEKALKFVLQTRLDENEPCPAALLKQVGLAVPEPAEETETAETATA